MQPVCSVSARLPRPGPASLRLGVRVTGSHGASLSLHGRTVSDSVVIPGWRARRPGPPPQAVRPCGLSLSRWHAVAGPPGRRPARGRRAAG